jgi:capsule polysaccharide export protein KpsE/RkpR
MDTDSTKNNIIDTEDSTLKTAEVLDLELLSTINQKLGSIDTVLTELNEDNDPQNPEIYELALQTKALKEEVEQYSKAEA